jgi:nitroreductase
MPNCLSGAYLRIHLGEAPVIVVPCLHAPTHRASILPMPRGIRGAGIPAVQNIILACRALGLGTTITTNHLRCEAEVRVLLGLPDERDFIGAPWHI